MRNVRRFVMNALMLTGVSLLLRTVGVSFNAFVSAKIGPAGMGLYSLIMSLYFFAVTFATSGVNLAATRLVAEALGRGRPREVRAVVRRCVGYSLFFGTLACLLLFAFSRSIGARLLGDARTVPSLRLLALSLPFIALSSALGGYFTAVRRVYKNAAAQLFEQAVKIFLCVYGLLLLTPHGIEYACMALVGGGALAEFLSFLFMLAQFLYDRRRHFQAGEKREVSGGLTRAMLGISLPVALSAYLRSGLVTVEHMLIPPCLTKGGRSREQALASYGILHGMVLPVVLYPSAISGAFAGLLVPELAECRAQNNQKRIDYIVARVFHLTLVYAIGTAGILIAFAYDLGEAIYKSQEAGAFIRMMAPLVPVMFLDISTDAILKGLGQQVYVMGVNIADALISILCVYLLLPACGVPGYVGVIYIAETINAALSVFRLLSVTGLQPKVWDWLMKPLLCVILAGWSARFLTGLAGYALLLGTAGLVARIALTALLYLLFVCLSGSFSRQDLRWMRSIVTGR